MSQLITLTLVNFQKQQSTDNTNTSQSLPSTNMSQLIILRLGNFSESVPASSWRGGLEGKKNSQKVSALPPLLKKDTIESTFQNVCLCLCVCGRAQGLQGVCGRAQGLQGPCCCFPSRRRANCLFKCKLRRARGGPYCCSQCLLCIGLS